MTIVWPAGVPYTALSGSLQGSGYRPPHTTDFEDGLRRQRRSTTKNIGTIQFTIRMDYTALAIFKAWVRDTLIDGTMPFTMPVWVEGTYADRQCAFVQPPRYAAMETDHADIAFVVDVEDW